MTDKWEFLLSEFRSFGGIAENVFQKEGEYGRGIFPVNSSLKAKIFTPSKLLIRKSDIELVNNKIRIKEDKRYSQDIRNFFNFYQDHFSWNGGGKEATDLFENGLRVFSLKLKQLIKKYALVDIEARHKGRWDEVIKKQFLNSRAVFFDGKESIAPIWELLNHEVKSLPFIVSKEGISIPSYPPSNGEIKHSYSHTSSLNRFFSYGFFSRETIVFSFPFSINIKNKGIQFCCEGKSLKDDNIKLERSANKITIEGLPIADSNHPRLPTYYFNEVLRRIGDNNFSIDFFSYILKLNIEIRKNIINESHMIDNEVSKILINLMSYEIDLILSDN